jgi:hypothetical protein
MTEPNTLDEQIREILGEEDYKYTEKPYRLLALFTEHSKEVDRLARIDELSKVHTVFYDGNFSNIKDRLTQLRQITEQENK